MYFNYDGTASRFNGMNYGFNIPISTNGIAKELKFQFNTLKKIIEREIAPKEYRKIGGISTSKFESGIEYEVYDPKYELKTIEDCTRTQLITLQYDIDLDGKKPTSAGINLEYNALDETGMLKLHDAILAIPNLEICSNPQIELEKISNLRTGHISLESIFK